MGSRSRIRWHNVAKLSLGVFGCLALFVGLPSLIRRPEPPPLDPDIGLAPVAASREPAPSGQRLEPGPERRARHRTGRRRQGSRSKDRRRPVAARRPTRHEAAPSAGSPITGNAAPAPAPALIPVPAADAAPPPAPTTPPPAAPPPARAEASQPTPTEFGFER